MRGKIKKYLGSLTILAVMLGGIQLPVSVKAQEIVEQAETDGLSEGITVTTRQEFMDAIEQHKSPIIVDDLITIGTEAEDSGTMRPVMIPENTLIQGTAKGDLCCRAPIQLEGDGICFQDIKLSFESTDALFSVPHREIFLAGHELTLDNVDTYLKGGASIGGIGGTEEELLPTVYAGGYQGTAVGGAASLTVCNSNDKTMFKGIYMGHGEGQDGEYVPYQGNTVLNIDAKTLVREGIYTSMNSRAEINVTGGDVSQYAKAKEYYGNENTTLTLSNISMDEAVADSVGNIVLKDGAYMAPKTDSLQNVTLQSGACLDFNGVMKATVNGNFTGVSSPSEGRGILVLNPEGALTITGKAAGAAQFQTKNRLFPGAILSNRPYIYVNSGSDLQPNFVLAQQYIENGYELKYVGSAWTTCGGPAAAVREIGRIELNSVPSKVDLRKIAEKADESIPDENIYFEVTWYDTNGEPFSHSEVLEEYFYEADYIIKIRTDYWESDAADILDKTDWYQFVYLMASEEHPGKYFLYASVDGNNNNLAMPGDYTFLFCSSYFEENLDTVADVKALKDKVKAECRVIFYNQDETETEKPEEPEKPEHKHTYRSSVTQSPTCTRTGVRTYTCSCGDKYTESLAVLNHRYVEKCTPATLKSNGKVQQICSVCSAVKNAAVINSPKKFTWSKTEFSYDGKVKTPTVAVKDSAGKELKSGVDYQVSYPKGRKVPGVYTVTVKFCGNYSGTKTGTFTITPKKTSLKKVAATSKGFQVTWKKQTAQTDGYEIQYSTSGSFKGKTTKTVAAKKNSTGKKIAKLKGNKKYYVRIRTCKTVKVNGKNKKLYSEWSAKKTVLTKK